MRIEGGAFDGPLFEIDRPAEFRLFCIPTCHLLLGEGVGRADKLFGFLRASRLSLPSPPLFSQCSEHTTGASIVVAFGFVLSSTHTRNP